MKVELFNNYKSYFKWRMANQDKIRLRQIDTRDEYITVYFEGEAQFFPHTIAKEERV